MARAIPIIALLLTITNILRSDSVRVTANVSISDDQFNEMNNGRETCIIIANEVIKKFKGEDSSSGIKELKNESDANSKTEAYEKFINEVNEYFETVNGMQHSLMTNIKIIKDWFFFKVESMLSTTKVYKDESSHIMFNNNISTTNNTLEVYMQAIIAEAEKQIIQHVYLAPIPIKFTTFDLTAQQINDNLQVMPDQSYNFDKIEKGNKQLEIRYNPSLNQYDCNSNLAFTASNGSTFSVKGDSLRSFDEFNQVPTINWGDDAFSNLEFIYESKINTSNNWPPVQTYKSALEAGPTFKMNAVLTVNGKYRHLKMNIYKSNNILRTLI